MIINAVNNRGGNLSANATNTEIANAISTLNLSVLGNVTYKYHYHDSNCTGTCGGDLNFSYNYRNENGDYWNAYVCSICGKQYDAYDMAEQPSICTDSRYTCGYSNGQIIGAEITY